MKIEIEKINNPLPIRWTVKSDGMSVGSCAADIDEAAEGIRETILSEWNFQ